MEWDWHGTTANCRGYPTPLTAEAALRHVPCTLPWGSHVSASLRSVLRPLYYSRAKVLGNSCRELLQQDQTVLSASNHHRNKCHMCIHTCSHITRHIGKHCLTFSATVQSLPMLYKDANTTWPRLVWHQKHWVSKYISSVILGLSVSSGNRRSYFSWLDCRI